ncbi:MAG: porin, partial [Pseudomonadota bacterium]|nr:porin [Pseudomonadota bacterium]
MKKNLIALAIFGAFSGAALAQSNVTLYGILDLNFQYNDPDAAGVSSTRGINSGHQSGSRWGVRGSEALSPNLNAVFTIEGGFSPDLGIQGPGGQGGRLFGRQAWAGLSGGWGTLVAGRVATFSSGTGSFDMFGNTDPFLTGFGDSSLGSTFTPSGALRLDNSVLYSSPSFGGFKFGGGYSFNANGTEGAGSGNNNRVIFLGANFSRGPFFAAVTYDIIDVNDLGSAG